MKTKNSIFKIKLKYSSLFALYFLSNLAYSQKEDLPILKKDDNLVIKFENYGSYHFDHLIINDSSLINRIFTSKEITQLYFDDVILKVSNFNFLNGLTNLKGLNFNNVNLCKFDFSEVKLTNLTDLSISQHDKFKLSGLKSENLPQLYSLYFGYTQPDLDDFSTVFIKKKPKYNPGSPVYKIEKIDYVTISDRKSKANNDFKDAIFKNNKIKDEISFFKKNIIYPMEAYLDELVMTGDVHFKFTINKNGIVENIKILKTDGEIFNKAITDVLKLFPKYIPATINKKNASVQREFRIAFTFDS